MQEQSITPVQIQTVFYIIKKHRWKIVALFLSTVITVAVGSLMATPIYSVSSKLLIKPGREDIYVSPAGDAPTVMNYSREGAKVNAEIAILTSLSLIGKLVDRIGVDRLYYYPDRTLKSRILASLDQAVDLADRIGMKGFADFLDRSVKGRLDTGTEEPEIPLVDTAYRALLANLEISAVSRSNVIDIVFEWPDPFIAARTVNTLVELYRDQHVKVHTNPQTYNLLKQQAEKWEKDLKGSEDELGDFKERHSITSLPQQKTILLGRLSEAESEIKKTETEIQERLGLIASLESQLLSLDRNVQLQETVNKTSLTLAALKAKLVDLELQGLKEEISRVKEMIAEEEKKEQRVVVSGKSSVRDSLESDLLRAKARLAALKARQRNQKAQIVTHRQELKTLDGFEKQLKELERAAAINETNYKLYLTKFEEAKISESMDKQKIASVRIIEPAIPVMKPVKPKKRLNVLIGAFLGLFAGISMAFLIEFLHPVFRTREDVQHFLGLPVLATLPKEKLG